MYKGRRKKSMKEREKKKTEKKYTGEGKRENYKRNARS